MRVTNMKVAAPVLLILSLSGCGNVVPDLAEPGSPSSDNQQMVKEIARSVYSELETAVGCSIKKTMDNDIKFAKEFEKNWGVLTTLDLTVDELTSFGPGANIITPIIPKTVFFPKNINTGPIQQSNNLGLGGQYKQEATRHEKLSVYFDVKTLNKFFNDNNKPERQAEKCQFDGPFIPEEFKPDPPELREERTLTAGLQSPLISSELKLKDWLLTSMEIELTARHTTSSSTDAALNTFVSSHAVIQHEVKFIILTDGNITPSWKLVRVSTATSPLFDAQRTRTHDLLITFGPKAETPKPKVQEVRDLNGKVLYRVVESAGAPSGARLDVTATNADLAAEIRQSLGQ